ncbi:glycosyltransferase [Commensalibacter papalotli (ex Servin-Garciduenas et al. 2014)]|uniref:Glycosyl transferase family protein n=1 Tax=Commensalibacter papalotli (ex Servin-Garciduenas et al. 2014) TaxID=1208583 RepID=W7DU77_9PROT|nr:glycosyltransferase [Commensalibacter papalotli (ex Servin-Garciduenas et al. 2014)]EUK18585.1 glycosyl transferase family protein [Commensalibacter papalotli (ex Servin-Garciduenas et al. 2014)]
MDKLRIAHVMAGAVNGGAELFYERLCAAQYEQGLNVLPIIRQNQNRFELLRNAGLWPRELSFGSKMDFRTKRKLKQYLTEFSPRVSVAWMNRAAYFMPVGDWVSVGRLGGFYDLKYYKNCDHLVGNTKGIVKWLIEQGWPKDRAHYVPNFARDFPNVVPKRPNFIPQTAPFLIALGRLHTNKGFDTLIKAMPFLKDAHLFIAGEGEERAHLEQLTETLNVSDRVHMPGWVEDISQLLGACDVFVCSSRHEPLGNIVLEAFAATKPVAALASQGPLELITDGENGLLSPLEDEKLLAQSIQKLLDSADFSSKIAKAGRKKFETEFSKETVLQQWYDFLSKVEKV